MSKLPQWSLGAGPLTSNGRNVSSNFVPALAQCPFGKGSLYLSSPRATTTARAR